MERHTHHTRLYAVLELTPTASKEDIRKAYRQLSLRWHPDKHPEERRAEATEKFREVAEAYEVLHDESQRELYDKYGEAGLKGEVPVQDERGYHYEHFEHHSPFDVFREFFANDPWMSQFFGGVSGFPFQHTSPSASSSSSFHRSHSTRSMDPFDDFMFGGGFGTMHSSPFFQHSMGSPFDADPFFQMPSLLGSFHHSHQMLHQQMHHHHHHHHNHHHNHQQQQQQRAQRQQQQLQQQQLRQQQQRQQLQQQQRQYNPASSSRPSSSSASSNQTVTRISFSDDHDDSPRVTRSSSHSPTIVSTRQSTQIINGQRTTITTTFRSDGSQTTITEGPDGTRQITTTRSSQVSDQPYHQSSGSNSSVHWTRSTSGPSYYR